MCGPFHLYKIALDEVCCIQNLHCSVAACDFEDNFNVEGY